MAWLAGIGLLLLVLNMFLRYVLDLDTVLNLGLNDAVVEGMAMASRAPIDLRVNTLKSDAEKAGRALEGVKAKAMPEVSSGSTFWRSAITPPTGNEAGSPRL